MLVGISEAIRVLLFDPINYPLYSVIISNNQLILRSKKNNKFNEWLAGYIDGDGYFSYSKKGYVSLEITTQLRDKKTLYYIKQVLGGSIKITNNNHIRYRLHHKEGLIKQINLINGELRNPIRLLQFKRVCDKYHQEIKLPEPLTYNNSWQSGFIDADGSIYYNLLSSQLFITATNNKCILDPLIPLYGGAINLTNTTGQSFKWSIYKKQEIQNILNYFDLNPLHSAKLHRIKLINRYFELRSIKAHLKDPKSLEGKLWARFVESWDKFESD